MRKIACPKCSTVFKLPENVARPGARLRCSVCKHVFVLEETENLSQPVSDREEKGGQQDSFPVNSALQTQPVAERNDSGTLRMPGEEAADNESCAVKNGELRMPPAPKSSGFGWLAALIILCALGGGSWWLWTQTSYLDSVKVMLNLKAGANSEISSQELIRDIGITAKQSSIKNEKCGDICVVEGTLMNNASSPRENIRVEASLMDKDGRVLIAKTQIAGTVITPFQLRVLSEQEIETLLTNRIDVLANNTNVHPGGQVPFMVVFYRAPAEAVNYNVKVVAASVPVRNQ